MGSQVALFLSRRFLSCNQVIMQSSCFSIPLPCWILVSFREWATASMLHWNRKADSVLLMDRGISVLELPWRASPVKKDERAEHLERCYPSLRRLLSWQADFAVWAPTFPELPFDRRLLKRALAQKEDPSCAQLNHERGENYLFPSYKGTPLSVLLCLVWHMHRNR